LTGAYNYDENADKLAAMEIPERLTHAMNGAKKLHPGQEGAVRSAHHVIEKITKPKARLMAAPAAVPSPDMVPNKRRKAPSIRRRTRG
jgi:hypothetical protein